MTWYKKRKISYSFVPGFFLPVLLKSSAVLAAVVCVIVDQEGYVSVIGRLAS